MRNSLIVLLFCSSSAALCQTGTIEGLVWDRKRETGLVGSSIRILGFPQDATADLNGRFLVKSIPVGTYDVRVWNVSYGDTTLTGVRVGLDSTTVMRISLPRWCQYEAHWKDKRCPVCAKKNKVVPIRYGLPIGTFDERKAHLRGCVITYCDPTWYCRRDSLEF